MGLRRGVSSMCTAPCAVLLLLIFVGSSSARTLHAADALSDIEAQYFYDFHAAQPKEVTPFGTITPLNSKVLPSLKDLGVSQTLFRVQPCAFNLPHSHPRALEILYLSRGGPLHTEFTEENGGLPEITELLTEGSSTYFPQGQIHYQQNFGCEFAAEYISTLTHDNPGVVTIPTRFYNFDNNTLSASMGISFAEVEKLRRSVPKNPAGESAVHGECMARCGFSQNGWIMPHYPFWPATSTGCQIALNTACMATFGKTYIYALFQNGRWGCHTAHSLVWRSGWAGARTAQSVDADSILKHAFNAKCRLPGYFAPEESEMTCTYKGRDFLPSALLHTDEAKFCRCGNDGKWNSCEDYNRLNAPYLS